MLLWLMAPALFILSDLKGLALPKWFLAITLAVFFLGGWVFLILWVKRPSIRSLAGATVTLEGVHLQGKLVLPRQRIRLMWKGMPAETVSPEAEPVRMLIDKNTCVEIRARAAKPDEILALFPDVAERGTKVIIAFSPAILGLLPAKMLVDAFVKILWMRMLASAAVVAIPVTFFLKRVLFSNQEIVVGREGREKKYKWKDVASVDEGALWYRLRFKDGKKLPSERLSTDSKFLIDFIRAKLAAEA